MTFAFECVTCGEIHRGMPSFGAERPLSYYRVPREQRDARCRCGPDACVIDQRWYFVRGCVEIPVLGESEPFVWGVWVSISKGNFGAWASPDGRQGRAHLGPFPGWLDAALRPYPDTSNLKVRVHPRDDGLRPYVELEPTDHPLAVEQREGISTQRVAQLYSVMMHE